MAFTGADRSITFGELDAETNRVAHGLLETGDTRPVVAVAPVRIDSLVLVLGALKAGRLVAPIDPRWPVEQWLEVARRTGGQLVVPDDAAHSVVATRADIEVVRGPELAAADASDPEADLDPDAPALVFFTSGSTGAPKGTLVGHAMPIYNTRVIPTTDADRRAIVAPLGFITGLLPALSTLMTGGSGHLFDTTTADVAALPAWLDEQAITIMSLSVSMMAMVVKAANDEGRTIDTMRCVVQGGEAGSAQHFFEVRRAFPNARIHYGFGMTETGSATHREVDPDRTFATGGPVPVGRPWPWVDVTIVDEHGEPVPDGTAGEIWVTSDQVALGYWDEPALTAERFVHHPDGTRTVRTGDRGRFRPDGMLEHLGRLDRQVKVHGQLVDLAQVEHEVEALPGVRDAVVSAVPTAEGAHRVVAHVVVESSRPVTVGELRRGLAPRLPPYAIPRAFFRVDDIPQTTTGKVDRAWLRESAVGALPLETEYVAPRDERERAVAALFADVLAVERVGVHDDFFELGGDSLSAVELLAGLADDLDVHLSASDLLRAATVDAVAARMHDDPPPTRAVVRVNDGTGRPLFCVPGAADTPVQFRPLGRRLADVGVHAFAYHGMDRRAIPDQRVAHIARRNIRAMREVAPGPYRLLGYSFGGTVALEMAHQLRAAGDEVELLALLEPALPGGSESRLAQSRAFAGRVHGRAVVAAPGSTLRARTTRTAALARAGVEYVGRQLHLASAGVIPRRGLAQHELFMQLHARVLRAYQPSPYHGRTILLASPRYVTDTHVVLDRLLPPESSGGRRHDVPIAGEHLDLVREPNVAEVARALDRCL
jgi:amino acid adenylation domain-containing protein